MTPSPAQPHSPQARPAAPRRRINTRPPPRRSIGMTASSRGRAFPRRIEMEDVKPADSSKENKDVVRIIPLGGVEEIGKNMTAFEYGGSICIVDIGVQFSDEETPGVDYIIPDTTYLEARKSKIKGIFVTHGHLDHIGGLPYIIDKIGNPPIYTRQFTATMIKRRQEEFPHLPALQMEIIVKDSRVKLTDDLYVRFFNVTHTIPDSMGVIFETPAGNIIFTGDLKVDHDNMVPIEREQKTFTALGKENNLVLLMDSTNADVPGWSFSESSVQKNLEQIIGEIDGRIFVATFASLLERILFILEVAHRQGKKVVIDGRSMRVGVEIAKELGMVKVPESTFITPEQMENYPDNKLIVIATGAQGDEFAALMRMGNKSHKKIRLKRNDTVILSSSIVPGNERSVQKLKDNLARQGAKILHYRTLDVHASGHANREELRWIISTVKPRFFIPIHGWHQFLRAHAEIALETGIPEENIIVPDNGMVIEFFESGTKVRKLKDSAVSGIVMVDSMGGGDVKEVVIRDRQQLAQDGMFVVVATVDAATGKVRKSPDIISRGFVYLKESQDLLRDARNITKRTIEETASQMHPINFDYLKNAVREKLSRLLLQRTGKRPIVLPVILEV